MCDRVAARTGRGWCRLRRFVGGLRRTGRRPGWLRLPLSWRSTPMGGGRADVKRRSWRRICLRVGRRGVMTSRPRSCRSAVVAALGLEMFDECLEHEWRRLRQRHLMNHLRFVDRHGIRGATEARHDPDKFRCEVSILATVPGVRLDEVSGLDLPRRRVATRGMELRLGPENSPRRVSRRALMEARTHRSQRRSTRASRPASRSRRGTEFGRP